MARPKGSKNKVKATQKKNQGMRYTFRATSCGCEQTSDLIGCGMFCQHKNVMILSVKG